MFTKTLYISDLDGTLLNANAELSATTTQILNRLIADGLHFSIATARTAASAFKILGNVQWRIPLVLMNGVLIYDPSRKGYSRVFSLSAEQVAEVISLLKCLNVTGLMYQLKDGEQFTYYESHANQPLLDFIEERKSRYNKVFIQTDAFMDIPDVIYFTFLDTKNSIQRAYNAFSKIPGISKFIYKDIYSTDLWYLELHSDQASKKSGADFLRKAYGFDRVVGFGDNANDLPMFEACDIRVAVANAVPEVLADADVMCGRNTEDGVARWLEEDARRAITHL